MIEKWIEAALTTLVARRGVVKLGAKGAPLVIFDTVFALLVGAGVLVILLRLFGVFNDALL